MRRACHYLPQQNQPHQLLESVYSLKRTPLHRLRPYVGQRGLPSHGQSKYRRSLVAKHAEMPASQIDAAIAAQPARRANRHTHQQMRMFHCGNQSQTPDQSFLFQNRQVSNPEEASCSQSASSSFLVFPESEYLPAGYKKDSVDAGEMKNGFYESERGACYFLSDECKRVKRFLYVEM